MSKRKAASVPISTPPPVIVLPTREEWLELDNEKYKQGGSWYRYSPSILEQRRDKLRRINSWAEGELQKFRAWQKEHSVYATEANNWQQYTPSIEDYVHEWIQRVYRPSLSYKGTSSAKSMRVEDLVIEVAPEDIVEIPQFVDQPLPVVPAQVQIPTHENRSMSRVDKATIINPPSRVSKTEWLKMQTPENQNAIVAKWAAKATRSKKRARRSSGYRRSYKRARSGGGGYRNGTNIIYPNVVGRGAYGLDFGIGYDPVSGFTGRAGGFLNDNPNQWSATEVTGRGDYSVKTNSLLSLMENGMSPPRFANTREAVVIKHREYLGDLITGDGVPTAFDLAFQERINPGNSTMFPFLSKIARNYQEYDMLGMLVELKTLSSNYAANLSLGATFAATEYNVLALPPTNKVQLENLEYASSCKPSTTLIMPIECSPRNNVATHLYVAVDGDYNGGDPRFSDLGVVFLGTQGCPVANQPVAEIWITYEVALFKPILEANQTDLGPLNQMWRCSIAAGQGDSQLLGTLASKGEPSPKCSLIALSGDTPGLRYRILDKQAKTYFCGYTWNREDTGEEALVSAWELEWGSGINAEYVNRPFVLANAPTGYFYSGASEGVAISALTDSTFGIIFTTDGTLDYYDVDVHASIANPNTAIDMTYWVFEIDTDRAQAQYIGI